MKALKFLSIILFFLTFTLPMQSQENSVVLQRTPEQEAAKQTEKLQQELSLTPEQAKQVYEINLKYARERQISNTRSEAVERMKNKNADVQRILNAEQNDRLQTKRYERSTVETASGSRNQPLVPTGFRTPADYRSNQSVRVPSGDINVRSNSFRQSSTPSLQSVQQSQSVRRSALPPSTQPTTQPSAVPAFRNPQPQQASPSVNRQPTVSSPSVPVRRSEPAISSGRR